jgi:hypothetical protein
MITAMKRITKIATLTILCIALTGAVTSAFRSPDQLTKEEAIELAEKFIRENGYTNVAADKSNLSYELFDRYENSIDSILSRRRNTLQPKAFCISADQERWNVGFLSTGIDLSKLDSVERQTDLPGRAVIVMKNGKEIRIAHKDPLFSFFTKL